MVAALFPSLQHIFKSVKLLWNGSEVPETEGAVKLRQKLPVETDAQVFFVLFLFSIPQLDFPACILGDPLELTAESLVS